MSNMGSIFVELEPWSKRRHVGIDEIIEKVNGIAARHTEAVTFFLNPPAISGLGKSAGLEMKLLDLENLGRKR